MAQSGTAASANPCGMEALWKTSDAITKTVLSYNWLVRRNKAVMDDVRSFGGDLHAVLLRGAAKA